MKKVCVSTFPFARASEVPLQLLQDSGFSFELNRSGKKMKAQELYEFAREATAVIAGTEDLSVLVEKSSHLKLIARVGIGLDSVPLAECRKKGIQVCYTPDAVTDAVAELTLGFMISLTRKMVIGDKETRKGNWQRFEGRGIKEQSIGLLGFGRIGKRVAELLLPFHPPQIYIHDLLDKKSDIRVLQAQGLNISQVSFDELIRRSDILSLHIPKTKRTQNILSQKEFHQMKSGSLVINTSRGGLLNENDLLAVLQSDHISGAGLDVFNEEPYQGSLCNSDQVLLTQHMGSCSFEARKRMELEAAEDVLRFLRNEKLKNPVDLKHEIDLLGLDGKIEAP